MNRKLATTVEQGLSDSRSYGDVVEEYKKKSRIDGVVIGKITGFSISGDVLVDFPGNVVNDAVPARSTVTLKKNGIGRDIALLFEEGDPERPIVMGLIQAPDGDFFDVSTRSQIDKREPVHVEVDGERVTFTAEKEIILRCGKASITLKKEGKIIIRGAYLSSRSSGVNLIRGGSVQIN